LPPVRSQANATTPTVREREAPVSAAKIDRRGRRTRGPLQRALLSPIPKRGDGRVTKPDIIYPAASRRPPLFAPHPAKDDLLASGFEDIRSAPAAERKAAEQAAGPTSEFLQPLRVVFRHVEGHQHVWQPLARKGGAEVVTRIMRDNVTDLVREHLRSQLPGLGRNQPQLEVAVQYV